MDWRHNRCLQVVRDWTVADRPHHEVPTGSYAMHQTSASAKKSHGRRTVLVIVSKRMPKCRERIGDFTSR